MIDKIDTNSAVFMYSPEKLQLQKDYLERGNITDFTAEVKAVRITHSGESEFVNLFGHFEDGTSAELSQEALWHSSDNDVVIAEMGRILAVCKGKAKVSVSYGGKTLEIDVIVEAEADLRKDVLEKLVKLTPEREKIISRAKEMIDFTWVPQKDLLGWKHGYTFGKGKTVAGIPYSQTDFQKDCERFQNALSVADFYSQYEVRGTNMPKYGNDCSAFVSYSWGISRNTTYTFVTGIKSGVFLKVGSYNADAPKASELLNSYTLLQGGDAVVKQGHTFLILQNNTAKKMVTACEQTPYKCIYNTWTYDNMAKGGYMPFKCKGIL